MSGRSDFLQLLAETKWLGKDIRGGVYLVQLNVNNEEIKVKVKNDPRSEFSNLSNWKEEA